MTEIVGTLELQRGAVPVTARDPAAVLDLDVHALAVPEPRGYDVLLLLGCGTTALVLGRCYAGAARVPDGGTALLRNAAGTQLWLRWKVSARTLTAAHAAVRRCAFCRTVLALEAKVIVCARCGGALCAECRPAGAPCIRCTKPGDEGSP